MRPFFKDNHFEDEVQFKNASEEVANWLLPLIKTYYSHTIQIDHLQLEEICGSNIDSGNYRLGNVYIKTIKHNQDKPYVLDFPKITKALLQAGIPISNFLLSDSGQEIVDHPCKIYQTNFYLYTQDFIQSSFFSGTADEMKEAMMTLKNLEKIELDLQDSKIKSPYLQWKPSDTFHKVETILTNKDDLAEFDQFAKSKLKVIGETLQILKNIIKELATPSSKINHYDLHPHNLFFKDGRFNCVIDLESFVKIQPQLTSAFALFKLGRKCLSKGFMTAEEFKTMAKENGFDLAKLLPYAQVELIRRSLRILDLHYLQNNTLWDSDIYKQIIGLEEVEILFN